MATRYYNYAPGDKIKPREGRKSSDGLVFSKITQMKSNDAIRAVNTNTWMTVKYQYKDSSHWYQGSVYAGSVEPAELVEGYSLTF